MGIPDTNLRETHIIHPDCQERFLPVQKPEGTALKRLDISLAGISELQTNYQIGRVHPNWHVLIYTLSGSGALDVEDASYRLRSGSVAFLPRFTTHFYRLASARWEILWFHLRPMETWKHLEGRPCSVEKARYLDLLGPAARGLLRESDGAGEQARRAVELYAELLTIYLERELSYTHTAREWETREALRKLWNEVETALQEPWDIARLARRVHVSEGHFHRLVREMYGVSPMEKLAAMRMHHAEHLLRSTNLPVYEIAEMVGYVNPYAFSTACRRFFGKSPREIRKDA